MFRIAVFALLLSFGAVAAYAAEGPQEKALDQSLSQTGAGNNSQSQPPASARQADDPSMVVSRPTQTEPSREGPEEKALDKSLQTEDGDTDR